MGRSYMFECPRCHYRAVVAGGADAGFHCWVQTIICYDCKALHDVPTRVRVAVEPQQPGSSDNQLRPRLLTVHEKIPDASSLQNRLFVSLAKKFRWVHFNLRCPKSGTHRIEPWRDPGKCPRCSTQLERTVIPYRIWD